MAVSESGRIINELRQAGLSMESIGQGIGRNRSLVRQVSIGAKPGNNLRDALAELRDRLATVAPEARNTAARGVPVTPPPRRTTTAGKAARVRRGTIRGNSWAAGAAKRQGARSGARSLGKLAVEAADAGMELAVTIQFGAGVTVESYSKGRRGQAGAGGSLDFKVDPSRFDPAQQNFTLWVLGEALRDGYITGQMDDPADYIGHVDSLEARVF